MIAAGNGVVFNVRPSAKKTCAFVMNVINGAIFNVCGIKNLVTMVKNPTMETANALTSSPKIRMITGTGGTGLVTTLI